MKKTVPCVNIDDVGTTPIGDGRTVEAEPRRNLIGRVQDKEVEKEVKIFKEKSTPTKVDKRWLLETNYMYLFTRRVECREVT